MSGFRRASSTAMIRIRRTSDAWLMFDRAPLIDTRLSFRAKGLLVFLLSLPGGSIASIADLGAISTDDRRLIASALRELEDAGYFASDEMPLRADGDLPSGVVSDCSALPTLGGLSEDSAARSPGSGEWERRHTEPAEAAAASAERVIDRLNELRRRSWEWVRYTPLSAKHPKNVEHINGRLREGYSEGDLVLVLEYLAVSDGGKDASRRYFDCVTPFNTRNFERNLTLARDWDARGRPPVVGGGSAQAAYGHDPDLYERRVRGG